MAHFILRDINNSNLILVNAAWANYTLFRSGSVSIASSVYADVSFPAPANAHPIIAVRSTSGFAAVRGPWRSGSNWVARFYGATRIEYWIFAVGSTMSVGGHLTLRNTSGDITFSTKYKYMLVIGSITKPNQQVSKPSTSKYALVMGGEARTTASGSIITAGASSGDDIEAFVNYEAHTVGFVDRGPNYAVGTATLYSDTDYVFYPYSYTPADSVWRYSSLISGVSGITCADLIDRLSYETAISSDVLVQNSVNAVLIDVTNMPNPFSG